MRLIDADKLDDELFDKYPMEENIYIFSDLIRNQPTAFEIDKVVQELEARKDFCKGEWETFQSEYYRGRYHSLEDAIEIVKRGGLNE